MKILLKEANDETLVVLEATEINYDPEERVLNIWGNQTDFEIRNLDRRTADSIINDVYRCERLDLALYGAVRITEGD